MPLDGHLFLVSQGWSGKGTGLRQGAITRPVIVNQKKTLSGIGTDRDEAFPFWDHLFSAAAKSIQVKISSDDDDESETVVSTETTLTLKRTTTGILCNRRPLGGTLVSSSGTSTPDSDLMPRLSLLAMAKREAAKRGLYARFFRGPILGPDTIPSKPEKDVEAECIMGHTSFQKLRDTDVDIQSNKKRKRGDEAMEKAECKEGDEEKRKRRLRKAEKKAAKLVKDEKRERKRRKLEKRADGDVTKEEWKRLRKELRALEREGRQKEDDEHTREKPKKSNKLGEAEGLKEKGKKRRKIRESDDTLDAADDADKSDKVQAGKKRKRRESPP
ncbi:hypothetical protein DFS33DRAFT_1350034 [Desarmillaria ectypa]|nr:hypothetical protein DFS33DRAFT_1350034 [Desarmillaria ectypa]